MALPLLIDWRRSTSADTINIGFRGRASHGHVGSGCVLRITSPCDPLLYNYVMSLTQQVQKDMVDAMRNKQELRLSTLRMMKAALQNKRIDKRADLDEREELQVFTTMIKQRKDSIEQFEKGNRPELAAREAQEIVIIEGYMPKAVGEEEIVATVRAVIAEMGSPTMKDMGAVMKNAKAKFGDARVDGKLLSEAVKKQLAVSS
jgi:uncharacterized protein YqeY